MRLKNKAPTSYRDGKVYFKPGEVKEMSDHDAQELLNKLPWHFEKLAADAKPPKSKEVVPPTPPVFSPPTPTRPPEGPASDMPSHDDPPRGSRSHKGKG